MGDSNRRFDRQRLRPERGAEFRLREGYGETSPELEERRRAPRESDPSTTLRVDLRLSKVERGWGPASTKSSTK